MFDICLFIFKNRTLSRANWKLQVHRWGLLIDGLHSKVTGAAGFFQWVPSNVRICRSHCRNSSVSPEKILQSPIWGLFAWPPLLRCWQQGKGDRVLDPTFSTPIFTQSFCFQLSAHHYFHLCLVALSQCFADSISPKNKQSDILQGVIARLKRAGEGIC